MAKSTSSSLPKSCPVSWSFQAVSVVQVVVVEVVVVVEAAVEVAVPYAQSVVIVEDGQSF